MIDIIKELHDEIDHYTWYINKKKSDISGPYGSVYSSEYKKNMRNTFKEMRVKIKDIKKKIKELSK